MADDIKIVADKEFSFLFENGKIVYTKGVFGSMFNIVTGNEGCCG